MTYYLLNYPRPIGIEPTIYNVKPNIEPQVVEVEPGWFLEDPYSNPEIIECKSLKEALIVIMKFNSTDDYLSNLRIKYLFNQRIANEHQ